MPLFFLSLREKRTNDRLLCILCGTFIAAKAELGRCDTDTLVCKLEDVNLSQKMFVNACTHLLIQYVTVDTIAYLPEMHSYIFLC